MSTSNPALASADPADEVAKLLATFTRQPGGHGEAEVTVRRPDDGRRPDQVTADAFAGLHMVAQMLQVMENAWLSVKMEGYHAHPLNRGWMNAFYRWANSRIFRQHWPTSAAVYLPHGSVPAQGTLFANTAFAETYARILREAQSAGGDRVKQIEAARWAWSHGFVAEAIDRFCRTQEVMDSSGARESRAANSSRSPAASISRTATEPSFPVAPATATRIVTRPI